MIKSLKEIRIRPKKVVETNPGTDMKDMYKGKLNKDQIATIKKTWAGKKASDVTQGVKDMVKKMDQFTRMDIKQANINHISALIKDEFVSPLADVVEQNEYKAAVRNDIELKEFTTDQISRLAKSYADLSGKTMSIDNANKLRKIFDRIPDSSLNALRKKNIPFISGLALSRMIQKKIPVTESVYQDESAWEVSGVENNGREELEESDAYDNNRYMMKKYMGQVLARVDNSNTKDSKDHVYAPNAQIAKQLYKQGKKVYKEELEEGKIHVYKVSHPSKKTWEVEGENEKEAIRRYKDEVGLKSDAGIKATMIKEADLTKSQIKQVHKQADELPKKDFIKRYGKEGDAVRYATATNQIKNKLGLGESKYKLKGELNMSESYKQKLTSAMEHYKISSLGELKPEDHKPFFAYVDNMKESKDGANTSTKKGSVWKKAKKWRFGMKVAELTPKQKMLDKDKDGDIEADDLAKVRAMKKEEVKIPDGESAVKPEVTVKDSNKTAHEGGDQKEKKDADMSKVKDSPKPEEGMKKATASTQANSKQPFNQTENKKYLQTKPGSLEEAVLVSRGLIEASGKFYQFEWVSGYKDEDENRYNFDGHMILVEVQSTSEAVARKEAIAFYKANLNKVLKSGKRMNKVNANKPTHEDYDTKSITSRITKEKFYPSKTANPKIVYLEDVEPGVLSY